MTDSTTAENIGTPTPGDGGDGAGVGVAAVVAVGATVGDTDADVTGIFDAPAPWRSKGYGKRFVAPGIANVANVVVIAGPCPVNEVWYLRLARYTDLPNSWNLYVGTPPRAGADPQLSDFVGGYSSGFPAPVMGDSVPVKAGEYVYALPQTAVAYATAFVVDVRVFERDRDASS